MPINAAKLTRNASHSKTRNTYYISEQSFHCRLHKKFSVTQTTLIIAILEQMNNGIEPLSRDKEQKPFFTNLILQAKK